MGKNLVCCLAHDKKTTRLTWLLLLWPEHNLLDIMSIELTIEQFRFYLLVINIDWMAFLQNAECSKLAENRGMVIPCLVEYMSNVTDTNCLAFLKRMRTMVFSDYRMIYRFVDKCQADIDHFHCGRLQQETAEVIFEVNYKQLEYG